MRDQSTKCSEHVGKTEQGGDKLQIPAIESVLAEVWLDNNLETSTGLSSSAREFGTYHSLNNRLIEGQV